MITRVDKPVNREVTVYGADLKPVDYVVTLHPGGLGMRPKGKRKGVSIPYRELYELIARYERNGDI